jgi:hypothetical protein
MILLALSTHSAKVAAGTVVARTALSTDHRIAHIGRLNRIGGATGDGE